MVMGKYFILFIFLTIQYSLFAQTVVKHQVVEVTGLNDTINYSFIDNKQIYQESWDTLAQTKFWRMLMTMSSDFCTH